MILHTFGTSAGTQPYPGFRHTCLAIETENSLYFFDAGESGAYTAHTSGVDLLKTRCIFLTHPHMDHVGGLGNLLWYIRKISIVKKEPVKYDNIDIFTSCRDTVDGFMTVLNNTEGGFKCSHTHSIHEISDGVVFSNSEIKVSAIHTNHMRSENNRYLSFAYKIQCERKTVIFTGDLRLDDLDYILTDCDALLIETGHHKITEVCEKINSLGKDVKKLFFVHHGKYIIKNFETAEKEAKEIWGENVVLTKDAGRYEI